MAIPLTISLRDAAIQLAPALRLKEKVPSDRLLRLLKAGDVSSGFQFPGRDILWIAIPKEYWTTVSSDQFRIIRYSDRAKSGAFKVSLGHFANEIFVQMNERLKDPSVRAADEWTAVLKATTGTYEVEIIEDDWTKYLGRSPDVLVPEKSTAGRHQMNWRAVSVIMGAFILKHCQTTPEKIKIQMASQKIHEIATAEKTSDLPASETIKDVLSRVLSKAETISIN